MSQHYNQFDTLFNNIISDYVNKQTSLASSVKFKRTIEVTHENYAASTPPLRHKNVSKEIIMLMKNQQQLKNIHEILSQNTPLAIL